MISRGVFITFEGGEGSGKSTQLGLLAGLLVDAGLEVEVVREPGGTRIGEMVREALLDPDHGDLRPRAELLLYEAARAQLVAERILPALATGAVVLCDRYADSSTAYQGYGRELPLDEVLSANAVATGGLEPDLTLLFDIDPALGVSRATLEGADRLEAAGDAFHARVRRGYLSIAETEPDRIAVIDGMGTPEQVAARVREAVARIPVLAVVLGEVRP